MLVTRCVDCGHQELTVNPECSCGCHASAPQPEVLPRRGPNAIMEELARRGLRDTAPQPPNTEPCDDCHQEPCVCVQPTPEQAAELLADYQQWLHARGEKDRRIAALEAQLIEAQARLAMAVEALRGVMWYWTLLPIPSTTAAQNHFIKTRENATEAIDAPAPAVAEFVARIKAKESADRARTIANWAREVKLRSDLSVDEVISWFADGIAKSAAHLEARAAELEGK